MARLHLASYCNRRQTHSPFNQLKLWRRRVPRSATIHLQRAKLFTAITKDACGRKNVQPKKNGVARNFGCICNVVLRQRNERNHVANLAIESSTDFVQNLRNWRSDSNRPKYSLFRSQQVLHSAFRALCLRGNQPLLALAGAMLIHWIRSSPEYLHF